MAQFNLESLWGSSLLGRFLTLLVNLWGNSLIYQGLAAVYRYLARISRDSFFGRIWYSDWPAGPDFASSVVGRFLIAVNDWLRRATRGLGRFLSATWESSLLVRICRVVVTALGPYVEGSIIANAFFGYASHTALAAGETDRKRPSPLLYLLGFTLGFLALLPAGGGLLNPTRLMLVGIWGTALLWLLDKVMTGDFRWRGSSALLPLGVFLLIAAAATWQSTLRGDSLQNLIIWITAGLLFFLCINLVRNTRDAAAFLGPILVASCLMAVWAGYQFIHPPVVEEAWVDIAQGEIVRPFAGMNNPNYLAEYMALFIPLAIGLLVQQPKRRIPMAGIVGLMGIALLLTSSRGGWMAMAAAFTIFVLMRAGLWSVLLFMAAAAGIVLFPWVAPKTIQVRVYAALSGQDTSGIYRTNVWAGIYNMLHKFWFLGTGLGANAFAAVYQEYMLGGARAAHAHNTYLQMLSETGVFGFGAILWSLFATLRRLFVTGVDRLKSPLVAAAGGALIGLMLHGFVEHIWYNPKLLFAFWAVAGLGLGLALGDKEDAAHELQTESPSRL